MLLSLLHVYSLNKFFNEDVIAPYGLKEIEYSIIAHCVYEKQTLIIHVHVLAFLCSNLLRGNQQVN